MTPLAARTPGPAMACPCGRARKPGGVAAYVQCCGRHVEHFNDQPAPDAESLMRSRYTAFVLERPQYLLATWHSGTRPAELQLEAGMKWLGLEVRRHRQTGPAHAEVEFVARHRDSTGRAARLHELSRFVKEEGRWYYVDGDTP